MVTTSEASKSRILVLNDFDPRESAGAARISAQLAHYLASDRLVFTFASTTAQRVVDDVSSEYSYALIPERRVEPVVHRLRNRFGLIDSLLRLFSPFYLLFLFKTIKARNIDTVWIHQIGYRFPYLVIPIAKILGLKAIITLHDYSYLRFRKLFPHDLDLRDSDIENILFNFQISGKLDEHLALKQRALWPHRIAKYFLCKATQFIYISALQQRIYIENGFPIGRVIENRVSKCSCAPEDETAQASSKSLSVLFAGRFIGKGLEKVCQIVKSNSAVHLHLAGGEELKTYVESQLARDRFTFHGFLTEEQLHSLIHKVDLVSVLSDCFDVFPTILLESIAHGTPTLTSVNTGTFPYIYALSPLLTPLSGKEANIEEISRLQINPQFSEKMKNLASKFTDRESLKSYLNYF